MSQPCLPPLADLARALEAGRTSSRALVEDCLARAQAPDGEGARVYLRLDPDAARQAADAADRRRARGQAGPWTGIPVSVKDLFDVAGEVTTAGSRVLAARPPARCDAAAVERLKAAGMVVVGRSNMTEFAYSGVGLNPHYGTPRNPYDRATGRIPGGSSSGAAISVTDGMAAYGLGTDTGGSCRIPAALTGLTGFKPTADRIPARGAFPLSSRLDSIGGLARTVECCAIADALLAGEPLHLGETRALAGLRLAIPQTVVLDGVDAGVAAAFDRAATRLSRAGARVDPLPLREFAELAAINAKGGFTAFDAYRQHRELLATREAEYDPRVSVRIRRGAEQADAEDGILTAARADWRRRIEHRMADIDFLLMPTVPTIAPRVDELAHDEDYGRINLLMLRNPTFINMLDGCAISLPCHAPGEAPVGLMLAGRHGEDRALLAAARAVEALLARPDR